MGRGFGFPIRHARTDIRLSYNVAKRMFYSAITEIKPSSAFSGLAYRVASSVAP